MCVYSKHLYNYYNTMPWSHPMRSTINISNLYLQMR